MPIVFSHRPREGATAALYRKKSWVRTGQVIFCIFFPPKLKGPINRMCFIFVALDLFSKLPSLTVNTANLWSFWCNISQNWCLMLVQPVAKYFSKLSLIVPSLKIEKYPPLGTEPQTRGLYGAAYKSSKNQVSGVIWPIIAYLKQMPILVPYRDRARGTPAPSPATKDRNDRVFGWQGKK